jgi:hypothetical protein
MSSTCGSESFPLSLPWSLIAAEEKTATGNVEQVPWYAWWLRQRLRTYHNDVFISSGGCGADATEEWYQRFSALWHFSAQHLRAHDKPCIDVLVTELAERDMIDLHDHPKDLFKARRLVFAVVGWQTMLYQADVGSYPSGQLGIVDEMDGYRRQGQILLKQDQTSCGRQMHQFLMGFGVLLPSRCLHFHGTQEEERAFRALKSVEPASFNAFLLLSIGRICIKWVDSVSHHMELDQTTKTLYLYRYPSFCKLNLPVADTEQRGSVIHAFAAPEQDSSLWMTKEEITNLMRETLMTYRLLFGQNKRARQTFRKCCPFDGIPREGRDSLLSSLCGRKRSCLDPEYQERDSYDLVHDFPMYRNKIAAIHRHLSTHKPRTWKEMWHDKRDSAQWHTFWLVLIVGAIGIVLTGMQVVLQIVQIAQQQYARPQPDAA